MSTPGPENYLDIRSDAKHMQPLKNIIWPSQFGEYKPGELSDMRGLIGDINFFGRDKCLGITRVQSLSLVLKSYLFLNSANAKQRARPET
ncbi:hypothetical protein EYC84_004249 [Monilinia fructicola]|uniref:Uncharacterized protein n=1 Tax=Monilinia fructicola TaxID=38448 RepID=A0A5M9JZQ9_MONFR|nr:hypothetical protein EYC84_004249 [Monilinia fructicola]